MVINPIVGVYIYNIYIYISKNYKGFRLDDARWPFHLLLLMMALGEITQNDYCFHPSNMGIVVSPLFKHVYTRISTWKPLNLTSTNPPKWIHGFSTRHKVTPSPQKKKDGLHPTRFLFPWFYWGDVVRFTSHNLALYCWPCFGIKPFNLFIFVVHPRHVQRMGFSALAATWRTWECCSFAGFRGVGYRSPSPRNKKHMSAMS